MAAQLLINGTQSSDKELPLLNHLGIGVFETFLVRRSDPDNFYVVALDRHFKRLGIGAEFIGSRAFSAESIMVSLSQASRNHTWTTDAARVRVVVLRDNWLLSVDDWSPTFNYEKGISLLSVEAERSYPQIKSCSALSPYLASEEAKDAGFDEALLIDGDGIVREGAWSNFFWIDSQGHLKTAGEKILPGVTRSMVLELVREKFEIVIGDFTLEQMLSEAKEAFITQSTHGIVPVLRINDSSFLELESSKNIAKLYHELMRNNQIAV